MVSNMKKKLIIDRSKWRTGTHGYGPTKLLNDEGYMCCLGFACKVEGLENNQICGTARPDKVKSALECIPNLVDEDNGYVFNRWFVIEAINSNDSPNQGGGDNLAEFRSDVEKRIKIILSPVYDVSFVGEYEDQK